MTITGYKCQFVTFMSICISWLFLSNS